MDNTWFYLAFPADPRETLEIISRFPALECMRANKLKLNPSKTEMLLGFDSGNVIDQDG